MKTFKSLAFGVILLIGGAWIAEASAQANVPKASNCPGYLQRRQHGAGCGAPRSVDKTTAQGGRTGSVPVPGGQTGGLVNYGGNIGQQNGKVWGNSPTGLQGQQGSGQSTPPGGSQNARPNRRSVSDLFYDDDTGAFFLRRADRLYEPPLTQRSESLHEKFS